MPSADPPLPYPGAWTCIGRGLRCVCPECGVSPVFVPVGRVRSIWDWFTPLDGCPRCGYAYEREEGYFLLATWGMNYGTVAGLGIILGILLDVLWHPPLAWMILGLAIPMPLLSFLLARHAKS